MYQNAYNYASAHTHLRNLFYPIAEVNSMSVKDAVTARFSQLCKQRGITVNELAYRSGVTPSTAYSMMDPKRRDISIVTIKKFCDGLDITLGEFFTTFEFEHLEQEIV